MLMILCQRLQYARDHSARWRSCVVQMIRYSAMTFPNHSRLTTLVRSLVTIRTGRQTVVIVVKPYLLVAVSTAVSSLSRLFSNVEHGNLLREGRLMHNGNPAETLHQWFVGNFSRRVTRDLYSLTANVYSSVKPGPPSGLIPVRRTR